MCSIDKNDKRISLCPESKMKPKSIKLTEKHPKCLETGENV